MEKRINSHLTRERLLLVPLEGGCRVMAQNCQANFMLLSSRSKLMICLSYIMRDITSPFTSPGAGNTQTPASH